MAHHYGNPLQKHPSYSHRETLRLQKKKWQREKERDREEGKGEGKREKQIEEVEQEEGAERREIDNQKLTATEREDRMEKKRRGDSRNNKNNGGRGNEATVVRDWHMRQCGIEGEKMGGVVTKAV